MSNYTPHTQPQPTTLALNTPYYVKLHTTHPATTYYIGIFQHKNDCQPVSKMLQNAPKI